MADQHEPRLSRSKALGAGVASVVLVAVVICRFGRLGGLSRDESVYLYAGQQLARGVPPYVSIFDPKGPLTALVIAGGAKVAGWLGVDDLSLVRVVFFVLTCAAVALIYWLGLEVFRGAGPAVVTAVVLGTSYRFARDAWSGPDPKTIAVLLMVAMSLAVIHRRWFVAGLFAGLATLTWQPLIFFVVVVAVGGAWIEQDRRLRAGLRALVAPVGIGLATVVWFAMAGAFRRFLDATLVFPFTGVQHADATWSIRIRIIRDVVFQDYGLSGWVFAGGLALFLVLGALEVWQHRRSSSERQRAVFVALGPPCVLMIAYSNYDFQGSPDLFPLLPFGALGCGLALAWSLAHVSRPGRWREWAAALATVVGVGVLLAHAWASFGSDKDNGQLTAERRDAATLRRLAGPEHRVLSLGDPAPLALAHLTNPDGYVYLSSGVADWKVEHTNGGMAGWRAEIRQAAPRVVVVHGTHNAQVISLAAWLKSMGFKGSRLGEWRILVAPPGGGG